MENLQQKLIEQLAQIDVLIKEKEKERGNKNGMCKASMETLLLSLEKRVTELENKLKN